MNREPHESNANGTPRKPWQFSLRRMFVATTLVALVFSCAAAGGWVKSDAPVYLTIAVLAGVFWSAARRALLGAGTIFVAFWLAIIFGQIAFGPARGRFGLHPDALWIFVVLEVVSSVLVRRYALASAWSLLASLVVFEIFLAAEVIIYNCYCPYLFQAFAAENRGRVFVELRDDFFVAGAQLAIVLFIVVPWLAGIAIAEILARAKKPTTT